MPTLRQIYDNLSVYSMSFDKFVDDLLEQLDSTGLTEEDVMDINSKMNKLQSLLDKNDALKENFNTNIEENVSGGRRKKSRRVKRKSRR